ncbi:hypothetical protein ABT390_28625 [Streptomyces aurantiacus]|uniref:Lipoprotein n=1 Tax=Streptomyces aurantiacus JA 4570 TaxID=1286094 RepID=S4AU47_9ACTN|nr:hypothetical protein [Streptomyces aurantiacus]EPH44942.1 hypothetical protein STRAU_2007 [Streptomyces aurantiacus JA 4570]
MQHQPSRLRPRPRRGTLAALCLTAAAAVALTACGGDKSAGSTPSKDRKSSPERKEKEPFADLSGPQIVDKAMEATRGARSLRLKGIGPDDEGGSGTMDVALNTKGECAGTIGVGGGTADLIATRTTVYTRFDAAALRSQLKGEPKADIDAAVDMMANRWTKAKATDSEWKDLAGFCDLNSLLEEFKGTDSAARKGKLTTVDGKRAITLHESDGKDRATLYVAAEGKPYLLKAVNKSTKKPDEPEEMTFTDYDKPVKTTPPTGDVLDLDELEDADTLEG